MAALIPDESRIPTVVAAVKGMLPLGSGAGGQLASRLERKLGISAAEARKRVIAYKQFLALKAASLDIDATKLSPPPLIDRVWHEVQSGRVGAGGSPFDVCISGFCL